MRIKNRARVFSTTLMGTVTMDIGKTISELARVSISMKIRICMSGASAKGYVRVPENINGIMALRYLNKTWK